MIKKVLIGIVIVYIISYLLFLPFCKSIYPYNWDGATQGGFIFMNVILDTIYGTIIIIDDYDRKG